MKVIILECAEELKESESMVDIRPIDIPNGKGHHISGFVALIKNEKKREYRLGELQARIESFDVNKMTL
jgi:hypothetical protein